jgi:hypothetical protein
VKYQTRVWKERQETELTGRSSLRKHWTVVASEKHVDEEEETGRKH